MADNTARKINKVEKALENCRLGHPLFFFESVSSTNDELKRLAHLGAQEGTVIWAEEQSAGRGRMGKEWLSKKGMGLYVSILLKPCWSFHEASFIPMLAALSVAKMLESLKIKNISIKWPNDVEVKGKKIAGVLAENCYTGEKLLFSVLGIGLNILHKKDDFEGAQYNKQPTSLLMEGVKISVEDSIIKLLQMLDAIYIGCLHDDIESVIEEVSKYKSNL